MTVDPTPSTRTGGAFDVVVVGGGAAGLNAQVIDAAAQGLKSAIAINADLTGEVVRAAEADAAG